MATSHSATRSSVTLALACLAGLLVATGCSESPERGRPEAWAFGRPTGEGLIYDQPVTSPDCNESAPSQCQSLRNRIWPFSTDASGNECKGSGGGTKPATGENSANWFKFGGCGAVKEFSVDQCTWVRIKSTGDSCDGCVLWHVNYVVEERKNGQWEKIADVDPPDSRGMRHEICVQVSAERFRIRAREGFYVSVYKQ